MDALIQFVTTNTELLRQVKTRVDLDCVRSNGKDSVRSNGKRFDFCLTKQTHGL